MYAKAAYPEYACKTENIHFSVTCVHIEKAHKGDTVKVQTRGYYEELQLGVLDFTSNGIDNGYPPVIQLTKVCSEVESAKCRRACRSNPAIHSTFVCFFVSILPGRGHYP